MFAEAPLTPARESEKLVGMQTIRALQGNALEDEFFAQRDAQLIARRRELAKRAHTQQELAEISGIRDAHVLARLVELDVSVDLLASLTIVPLVEVAWADGTVDAHERQAILASADSHGFAKSSIDYELLDAWLYEKPPAAMLEAWMHYIRGLCAELAPADREALRRQLLDRARAVAEASGGLLGLTSRVSAGERAMLDTLAAAFDVP